MSVYVCLVCLWTRCCVVWRQVLHVRIGIAGFLWVCGVELLCMGTLLPSTTNPLVPSTTDPLIPSTATLLIPGDGVVGSALVGGMLLLEMLLEMLL